MRLQSARLLLLFAVMALAIHAPSQAADDGSAVNPQIVKLARDWLALLDDEQYEEVWQQTSRAYRSMTTREDYTKVTEGVRRSLGKSTSRVFWREMYSKSWSGRADGNYYMVVFSTTAPEQDWRAFRASVARV